jgi:hypothetical protein
MKLSDIKTLDQLYKVGDIWHNRAKNLMNVFYKEPMTLRAFKAYLLYLKMLERIKKIMEIAWKLNQPQRKIGTYGGLIGENSEEFVIHAKIKYKM